ncbi:D-aminoacyl-tRNA deacylase [Glaciecola sp. 1036]|uniref:D-aminoacyl-tRNA deacylase n=1 Tax=Alteromonadaceae TaxID=72275 RepID=UPI003CFF04B3
MIGLIQRVSQAQVDVAGQTIGKIGAGILLLLGIEKTDTQTDIEKLAKKIMHYRIFPDQDGKMNLSLLDTQKELLVVSQFTLVAETNKGNRPGFSKGASPEEGKRLYEAFLAHIEQQYGPCECGEFGADMQVSLINDGPVTFYFQT